MEGQNTENNVISLFAARASKEEKKNETSRKNMDSLFLEAMRRNAENNQKLKQDRLKANKSVLKSYRIKN